MDEPEHAPFRDLIEAGDAAGFSAALADSEATPSLEAATFEGLLLADFDLSGVDLSNSEWSQCTFERVRFGDLDLQGAYFDHAQFTDCTFEGTDLSGASFDAAHFVRTAFVGAVVADSEIEKCQLLDCELRDLVLEDVAWSELSATRIRLARIDGRSGELTGLTLREATFEDVDLGGVTCTRCRASLAGEGELPAGFQALTGRRRGVH